MFAFLKIFMCCLDYAKQNNAEDSVKIFLTNLYYKLNMFKHYHHNPEGAKSYNSIILFPQVLIFSQFTLMLDILEDYLYMRNIRHCRLDGRCKVEDRQLAVSAQQVFTRLL